MPLVCLGLPAPLVSAVLQVQRVRLDRPVPRGHQDLRGQVVVTASQVVMEPPGSVVPPAHQVAPAKMGPPARQGTMGQLVVLVSMGRLGTLVQREAAVQLVQVARLGLRERQARTAPQGRRVRRVNVEQLAQQEALAQQVRQGKLGSLELPGKMGFQVRMDTLVPLGRPAPRVQPVRQELPVHPAPLDRTARLA